MLDYLIGAAFTLGVLAILICLAAPPEPPDWHDPKNWR